MLPVALLRTLGIGFFLVFTQLHTPTSTAQNPAVGPSLLHANGELPTFAVATVKQWLPRTPIVNDMTATSDVAHLWGNTRGLIMRAYQVNTYTGRPARSFGGPDWIDQIPFVIEAKVPAEIYLQMQKMTLAERIQQQCLMLQALLADRFKLRAHFERRTMPVWDLVLAKGGPKLPQPVNPTPKPSDQDAKSPPENLSHSLAFDQRRGQLKVTNEPLDQMFTMPWAGLDEHIVVNRTGLHGRYSFTLEFGPESNTGAPPPPSGPTWTPEVSIFSAAQQLGLKLVPGKAEVEVLIIDHIEMPTDN